MLTLIVQQLLASLSSVFSVWALNDGVNGARLLAESAVDALGHIEIVAGRASRAVSTLLSLNGNGLRRADLLADLVSIAVRFHQ